MAIDLKNIVKLDAVMKLPLSKKIIILAGIIIAIAALSYQLLLKPQTTEIANLTVSLAELTVKVEENRRIAADIPRFQKEKDELEEQLKKALSQLPNEKEIPNLIDSISELPRIVNIQNIATNLASSAISSKPVVKAQFVTLTFRFVSPEETAAAAAEAAKKKK